MNSASRVQTPEGREAETHSDDVIFKKVGREPNRFEIVFSLYTLKYHHLVAAILRSIPKSVENTGV